MKTKALLLFSGGLDSRLAAKLLEEQGLEVELVFVRLPFGGGCCNNFSCILNFSQTSGLKLHVIDATKGKPFQDYLELVKNPKHGRGTAMNPCKDCKIFLFKQAKKLAEEIGAQIIATGEVLNQRPMSQTKKALLLDDEYSGLKNKILRPLSAKLLPETDYEKKALVDREKFLSLQGRQRKEQMKLAEKYKIKYPSPAGGCLLCEKDYSRKLKELFNFKKSPLMEEIMLLNNSRMFKGEGIIFVGKNKMENLLIEELNKKLKYNLIKESDVPGPTVIYSNKKDESLAKDLWKAYSSKDLKLRKKFEKFKV
jgi:tRNA U34 2-thiouridine synthase MnmA/TrmU